MMILYDFIALIMAISFLPVYIFRKKFHRGFLMRLGFLPAWNSSVRPVWIHAVSVGEAMAIKNLAERIKLEFAGKPIVFSTVTPTGNKIVRSIARSEDLVLYLPLDFSFIVDVVLKKINPSLFIIVETELWPNLLIGLKNLRIPVLVVNARISDRSFKGYRSIKWLLKPLFKGISMFFAQSASDKERLLLLGVNQEQITLSGNMKFDGSEQIYHSEDISLCRKLRLQDDEILLVAGSTHSGEEEILLDVYEKLRTNFSNLRLLLAPRHPERSLEVAQLISRHKLTAVNISECTKESEEGLRNAVFVLDSVGVLMNYYAIADIVFVGGSLIKKGGHNILEPASLGKPILFGRYMFNFRDIAELFIKQQAACKVNNALELQQAIYNLLNEPKAAKRMGQLARSLIVQHQGATEKIMQYLEARHHAFA